MQADRFLNWEEHLLAIAKKGSRGIGMLRYATRYLPLVTVQMTYISLIEAFFGYPYPIWGIQVLQTYKNYRSYRTGQRE